MITIRPGSHVHTLLTVLSFVGEYPVTALGLLGSARSYKDLIYKLSMPQEFRFPDREERFTCRLLTVSGKGKRKTIRMHKSALPLLKYWDEDAYDNYMAEFDEHTFSGNARHVERNHLVAEAAVMCMKAGIEARPLGVPDLMDEQVRLLRMPDPYFYFARDLKRVNEYEMNKIRFTRLAGVITYPGGCYAVYNTRDEIMNWMGDGEMKIKLHLHSIFKPLHYYDYPLREAAVMFGKDYDTALEMLEEMKRTKNLDNGLFHTFRDIFFVPMNDFGVRLLRVLTTWNWKERILNGLFDEKTRSFDRGSFTYDAHVNDEFQISFLDGNIRRLFHFREAILNRDLKCRVVCYHEQVEFIQKYLGDLVTLRTGKIDTVESWLEIDPVNLLSGEVKVNE